jgi:hypothetical protein
MCWEWMFDAATNHIQFWVDGQLMRDISGRGDGCTTGQNGTWSAPSFGSIELGEFNAQTSSAQTRMWLDDVALGTEARIGCPAGLGHGALPSSSEPQGSEPWCSPGRSIGLHWNSRQCHPTPARVVECSSNSVPHDRLDVLGR